MSGFDFEISARLAADELTSHVPPDAGTEPEGNAVRLGRRQAGTGLPAEMRPGERYEDVAVEKQIVGRLEGDTPT